MVQSLSSPLPRRRRGFSLPELLVVLVIVIFASTIALLAYSNYRKGASVRSSAERVKALLVEARTRAIAKNAPASATFDLTNQVMWVDELNSDETIRSPKVVTPEYFPLETVLEELRVNSSTYSTDIRKVVFQPDGRCPLITVILRREQGDTADPASYYSVQMYPTSAEPKVWPNVRR
ncbi:prepilin-type N-terminal cleavage/methylation domain-containing protein [bacterium]|nr:prepilin-type N-terminal cleavage/methylation domain-containing protein [bacterium]